MENIEVINMFVSHKKHLLNILTEYTNIYVYNNIT